VRDTLNLIHDLDERGIAQRNLADPITVDTTDPEDSMGRLAVLLLAMFAQMERTYSAERAAHARAVATAQGRRIGRPVTLDPAELERARCRGGPTRRLVASAQRRRTTRDPHTRRARNTGRPRTRKRPDPTPRPRTVSAGKPSPN